MHIKIFAYSHISYKHASFLMLTALILNQSKCIVLPLCVAIAGCKTSRLLWLRILTSQNRTAKSGLWDLEAIWKMIQQKFNSDKTDYLHLSSLCEGYLSCSLGLKSDPPTHPKRKSLTFQVKSQSGSGFQWDKDAPAASARRHYLICEREPVINDLAILFFLKTCSKYKFCCSYSNVPQFQVLIHLQSFFFLKKCADVNWMHSLKLVCKTSWATVVLKSFKV